MPTTINLVLQGGGVKGIALVGALNAIENNPALKGNIIVDGIGGVSVGALVAALYAAGYTAIELADELDKTPILQLIERRPLFGALGVAKRLTKQKGIYSTEKIYTWVQALLKKKSVTTFAQLKRPCRIFAANVTGGSYEVYSKETAAGQEVASAVLKSLSIPLFFTPYIDGHQLFVDGGMLSNYPLWLFKESRWPTIGVKLVGKSVEGPRANSGLVDFLKGLIDTMLGAHDQLGLGNPPNSREIIVRVEEVDSTDFHIEDNARNLLFERGQSAVGQFEWNTVPPPRATVFNDQNGAQILEDTANSIALLLDGTRTDANRSYDYYHSSYLIRPDGSAEIEKRFLLRNSGPEPISWIRHSHSYDYEVDVSFKELGITVECKPSPNEAVILPTGNTRLEKAYAIALIPPLLPGEYREMIVTASLPQYFLRFINYEAENISSRIKHEGGLKDNSLTLRLAGEFAGLKDLVQGGAIRASYFKEDPIRTFVWKFADLQPGKDFDFKINFRRR